MDPSDRSLLDRYLTGCDEAAFGLLVARHLDFVHAVALRVTRNDELARDVAQTTFIRLARRAALVPRDLALPSWLHRITRGLAVDLVRVESHRKQRELGSELLPSLMETSPPEPDWSALAPVVDELIDHLSPADRDLLLLRYYRNESHASIAARLGLTQSTARKRTFRAVERLRALLGKRGITTSASALATLLPAHAMPAAPGGLAISVLQATQGITPIVPNLFTTLVLAVNTSQKIALACSLLLLLAATGYTLSPYPAPAAVPATAAHSATKSEERPASARERSVRPAALTAEERRERLMAIMAIPNRVERDTLLIAWLDGLPPELFAETVQLLLELSPWGDRAISLAVAAWAKVDLPAARDFATGPNRVYPPYIERQFLCDWGATDPQAALQWTAQSANASQDLPHVLWGIALTTPEEIGRLIRELPEGEAKWGAFAGLTERFQTDGDPALLERIVSGASESQRAVLYGNLAGSLKNYAKAVEIMKDHPEALPFSNPRGTFFMWANQDLPAASAALAALPEGPLRQTGAAALIRRVAETDATKAVGLIGQYPDSLSGWELSQVIQSLGKSSPELALAQTPKIPDEGERHEAVAGQLAPWLINDPAGAAAWLENHPQPAAVMEKLSRGE